MQNAKKAVVCFTSGILVAIPVVYYVAKAISKKLGIEMLDIDIESYSSVIYIVCLILGLTLAGLFAIPEWLKKKKEDVATKGSLRFCPQCKAFSGIPLIYGYPSKESLRKASNGEIALGGCIVRSSSPRWQCKNCGNRWGGKEARQSNWESIGNWETFQGSDKFEGYIPDWIKKRIRIYLGQIGKENLNKIKDPKKREKLILDSKVYQGIKYVRDKYYLYKLDCSEGDETNSVTVYRKRRLANRGKYVRTKSKV